MSTKPKIRNIHKSHKFFGYVDEKWARDLGTFTCPGHKPYGYGRNYGLNKNGALDFRTKTEIQSVAINQITNEMYKEWEEAT